jgi:hypothetical protein
MPDRLGVWLNALDQYEFKLRVTAGRARNAAIIHAAQAYQYTGTLPGYIAEGHRRRLKQILTDHYERVTPHFAAQALASIRSKPVGREAAGLVATAIETKTAVTFAQLKAIGFAGRMQEWIGREALRKATLIAATDLEDVRGAISDGVSQGQGTAEIARNIRQVSRLTPFRAATVARTETHAAATFGSIETVRDAERDLGVRMLKAWLPTLDDRTRPDHRAMTNHPPIPLDETFSVGGERMDRPGDPSASPANLINCRCAISFEEATT